MRTWIIGSGPDCDIVVAQPRVSRRHCRFTERADGHLIEDLGSSNGTYVNGERIAAETLVSAVDTITLGALVPMPWPPASGVPGASVLRIGRAPDNDVVLDDPRVSSHHARLLVTGSGSLIEDAGSANGTFLNAPDGRVTEATPLTAADTLYFGSLAVPAARLLPPRPAPAPTIPAPPPLPESWTPPPAEPTLQPPLPPAIPWAPILLAQAPVIAVVILLLCGRPADGSGRAAIAATMFGLAMGAVWLGGSLAAWDALAGRPSSRWGDATAAGLPAAVVARLLLAGALAAAGCALMLLIVYWGSGLRGAWPPMLGILLLTAAVGLLLGRLIFALIRHPAAAAGALLAALLAMAMLGRGSPAAPAAAMPSRWAFEGLLLLENDGRPAPQAHEEAAPGAGDLAEGFFPTDSRRMGPRADAMALGFMLFGLAGASAFVATSGRSSAATGAGP